MSSDILLAICAMTVATVATRLAGLIVPAGFARHGRMKAAFESLPIAVLTSIIAPTILTTGWPESIAALLTIIAAWRLPMLAAIAVGVVAAASLRLLATVS